MSLSSVNMSFRVENSLKEDFATVAKSNDRNASQLLRDFMRNYIEKDYETWFDEQVNKGLASAKTGKLISAEEVESKFSLKREALRHKLKG